MSIPRSDVDEPAERPAGPIDPNPRPSSPVTHRVVPRVAAALVVLALVLLVVAVVWGDVLGGVGSVVHQYYRWLSGWFPLM